jgi:hypothetical protein
MHAGGAVSHSRIPLFARLVANVPLQFGYIACRAGVIFR